jgi:hypothetical protein
VDSFTEVVTAAVFVTCSADIFDSVTKVEVQSLVSDKIPNLDRTSSIVVGSSCVGVGQCLRRLVSELPSTKHWRCKARKIVTMSSFLDSGWFKASSIRRILNCCSIVNSTIGGGGPKFDGLGVEVIIGVL